MNILIWIIHPVRIPANLQRGLTVRVCVCVCMNFIHNFDTEHGNLLLFGNTGIGKTFLSHCIAKEVMDSLYLPSLYLTASEFFDALLEKALARNDESCLLYEQIHQRDLLIIDDLGTERNTDFVVSQFRCLNDRS